MSRAGPLAGQRVLVTRPAGRTGALGAAFERVGARVETIPTIRLGPPDDPARLTAAVGSLGDCRWVVLSSAAGVERLAAELDRGPGRAALRGVRVAAVGPATARALAALGVEDPLVPDRYVGESLARAIVDATPAAERPGARVLLVRAQEARSELPRRLRGAGFVVDDVPAYATRPDPAARSELLEAVESGRLDWLTFTAASTVRAFVELVGAQTAGARVAAIGPVTAAAVGEAGLPLHAVATRSTSEGLVEAVVEAVGREAVGRETPSGSGGR